jgi:hypothetical protein
VYQRGLSEWAQNYAVSKYGKEENVIQERVYKKYEDNSKPADEDV